MARLRRRYKFKKLGFIEYDGQHPLKVNGSLLSVILHERA
jgi:hypothetical protein